MMFEEARIILRKITYKPNIKLILERDDFFTKNHYLKNETAKFMLECTVPDSTKPDHPEIVVVHNYVIDLMLFEQPEEFIRWVYFKCQIVEMHELDEFFKVDSIMLKNPHEMDRKLG